MKRLKSIGLLGCLSVMFLAGCGGEATPTTDHTTVPGYESREFDYTNRYGEVMHCLIIDAGYNSAVMSCVLAAPKPISTPTPN